MTAPVVDRPLLGFAIAPLPEAAHRARHRVRDVLLTHRTAAVLVDDLEVITSELVTNAVQHGHDQALIGVRLTLTCHGWIVLEISNKPSGPTGTVPTRQDADAEAESGRGLALVESIARCHGAGYGADVDTGGAITTWCSLPYRAEAA
ncbi:ATP-binding protein [Streptomyces sp. NPDC003077]|uniref:ATP-binding protein n=1 Tax=Streptomyces sp. NPDC003077 TaxID=3154443 RepID=UPI0033B7B400